MKPFSGSVIISSLGLVILVCFPTCWGFFTQLYSQPTANDWMPVTHWFQQKSHFNKVDGSQHFGRKIWIATHPVKIPMTWGWDFQLSHGVIDHGTLILVWGWKPWCFKEIYGHVEKFTLKQICIIWLFGLVIEQNFPRPHLQPHVLNVVNVRETDSKNGLKIWVGEWFSQSIFVHCKYLYLIS